MDLFNDANVWAGATAILLVVLLGSEAIYQRHITRQRDEDHDR